MTIKQRIMLLRASELSVLYILENERDSILKSSEISNNLINKYDISLTSSTLSNILRLLLISGLIESPTYSYYRINKKILKYLKE